MGKYIAMAGDRQIISIFADDVKDAERIIGIHLRGRPGGRDLLYKEWIDGGKKIRDPHEEVVRVTSA